jgi:lipopolysaccharide assembly protein A
MRAINFLIIFLVCLALVLFSLENTEPVMIKVVKGVDIQAPLCIELIAAMGLGAILAWLFSVWSQFQRLLASRKTSRELRERDNRIQALEKDLEQYKTEILEQPNSLPSTTEPIAVSETQTEVIAQS